MGPPSSSLNSVCCVLGSRDEVGRGEPGIFNCVAVDQINRVRRYVLIRVDTHLSKARCLTCREAISRSFRIRAAHRYDCRPVSVP